MQLVLDTNVWIDWLVFNDPSIAPLKAARQHGRINIVVNAACLEELHAVLAYPEFNLDDARKKDHLAEIDRLAIRHGHHRPAGPIALPRCSDPDDQKFLMLALDAAADWLLTRDKALLKLNRHLKSAGLRVGSPAQWSAAFVEAR
ncbi:MAG TPA: putative toxin-antitoxin system toxin component, PIN family [Burkholderiales bacterium]|nr:putative toxin-antitoxin system toxin component, PIN family [Burkholderiales bacterium]